MTITRHIVHRTALVLILFLILGAMLVDLIRYVWSIVFNVKKAWVIALAQDDAANVALNGRLGQSISSRAAFGCQAHRPWGCAMCDLLDEVDPGHCKNALTAKDQNL